MAPRKKVRKLRNQKTARAKGRKRLKRHDRMLRRRRAFRRNPSSRQRIRSVAPTEKNRVEVTMPARLCFIAFPAETAAFFTQLRKTVSSSKWVEVTVDHRPLVEISPAAALVLLAELYYGRKKQSSLLLMCIFPNDRSVIDLLGEIGYFKYFKKLQWNRTTNRTRLFLEHRQGAGVDRIAAAALVSHLRTTGMLESHRLYEALIEGMQNADEHGYGKKEVKYRQWWLLGYRDLTSGEIAYCFYDQGVGIPVTIRPKLRDRIRSLDPAGSRLIRKAVLTGHYSRTGKPSRGRGLPTLKRFIDTATKGELMIFSKESRCIFRTGTSVQSDDFRDRLQGTLISWTFRK